jgi:hypothetical protein
LAHHLGHDRIRERQGRRRVTATKRRH